MKLATIIRYVGMVLLIDAAFMLLSALVSLFNGLDTGFFPLLLSCIITTIIGVFPMIFVPKEMNILGKEGSTIVIMSWIMSCAFGMLPYLIWGGEFSFANAWFESTSGYTTTGSTILTDVEALPKGLLFWRACTHWIGGVGVVLFALVILPSISSAKMALSNVEMSNLAKDNFKYNTKKMFKIIIFVYGGLTFAEVLLLKIAGMTWFDAVAQSFSTIATGGFSTKNLSIAYWDSVTIEVIIMIFMVLGGTHFGLIYATIIGKRKNLFRSEVWKFFIIAMTAVSVLVAVNLLLTHTYGDFWESLRYSSFQVISYATTAGFASTDAAWWPPFAVVTILFMASMCAMAGSTSGGIKTDRVMLLVKSIKARVLKLQHPNAVIRVKLNGVAQEDSVVNAAIVMIAFYVLTLFLSTVVLTIYNIDLLTSFSVSVAALGNVGPGFGEAGNLANLNFLPDGVKFFLSLVMLFGRLELFGLINIFLIRSWK